MKWLLALLLTPVIIAATAAAVGLARAGDWRTASREPVGLAPDPATTPEAVVQVYAARTWGWRGALGVHTWIAIKPSGAPAFTVYEVIGWRLRWSGSALVVHERPADARWFGAEPHLVVDRRGDGVDAIIDRIREAVHTYPYADTYRAWPGPNSNTFTAHVLRAVPELRADLPPTAIGKDYLTNGAPFDATPSGTGFQVSLFGLLGVLGGIEEGIEVNLLGLTFGVDPKDLALKLPAVGRIGL
ncbi:MAG: DUF3750 domain-containing protein [Rhodobacterales bacterium]|nr:DUF3750 domain-containing protein [Rhodobacterales bacterium]